jgi:flagellar motor switch protein FliG
MITLDNFIEDSIRNNQIVQHALREFEHEPEVLAVAMVGLEDKYQQVIFRNMTVRARRFLAEDINAKKNSDTTRIINARDLLMQRLQKHSV